MPTPYMWPLASPPPAASPAEVVDPASDLRGTGFATIRGLLRPFRRDGISDFASGEGTRLAAAKIGQVLGTRCADDVSEGELPWRDEFGSLCYRLQHRNIDEVFGELARTYSADAIARWLPSIRITEATAERLAEFGDGDTTVVVHVGYDIVTRTGGILGGGTAAFPLSSPRR